MRVLHLYSNKRWTGPAEPAALLAAGLQSTGMEVTFACAAAGDRPPHQMAAEARARGLTVRTDLHLNKHAQPLSLMHDARVLAAELREHRYDLLHCHQPADHLTAGLARRWAKTSVPIVRSVYDGAAVNGAWRNRFAIGHWTDALCVPGEPTRANVAHRRLLAPERLHIVDGAVDTCRFDPDRPLPDARGEWGMGAEHVVFGVVARMQPYRRFHVLLEAFREVVRAAPHARLVFVGRGTREEDVLRRPIRQMRLEDSVHMAGYLQQDAYVAALAAMDVLIFLMPGSDGTCRTVREALALGVPVLAADRGILPWLVETDRTGLVVQDTAQNLRDSMVRLATEPEVRESLRAHARTIGPERFALARQVETVRGVYEALAHA